MIRPTVPDSFEFEYFTRSLFAECNEYIKSQSINGKINDRNNMKIQNQKLLIGALVGLIGLGAAAVVYKFWSAGSPQDQDQDEAESLLKENQYSKEENKELPDEDLMNTKPKQF